MAGQMIYKPSDFSARTGELFRAATVPGNPIADAVKTAFADTAASALIRNTSAKSYANGGKLVLPRYARFKITTVPASATSGHFALTIDDIDRYSSGGTQMGAANTTVGNMRSDMLGVAPTAADVRVGAITLAAASAHRKIVAQGTLRSAIPVAGDVFLFVFGDPDESPVSQDTGGTTAKNASFPVDPVCLVQPDALTNHSLAFHFWYPGNAVTPASYEVDFGWTEDF